jgi:acyl-coenzyme A thioesterase PaaI-like protein
MTVHRGRTVAAAEGDLRDKEGRLYAHATTTCMIFPARAWGRLMESTIR